MNFVAIDVETANASMASICQIGLARYSDGEVVEEWKTYIDPEDYFDAMNISVHGIDEEMVIGAPTLPEIFNELHGHLNNHVAVCHTHFDRVAINQAIEKYELKNLNCTWLDSARVARRAWEECAYRGYGIANICQRLGYEFQHHDALEDAKAAGYVLLAAIKETGLTVSDWLIRVELPICAKRNRARQVIEQDGNPEGPLFGEVIVFTGSLRISRGDAADMAAKMGCKVARSVTKSTTILVVGDQDVTRLAGHAKSSKHRKAEKMNSQGQGIKIMRESDFGALVSIPGGPMK